jgi:hypothetical protein
MSSNPETGSGRSTTFWQALTHGRTLFTLLMFSIFAIMVWIATGYTWPANFLPFVIGIPGIALTLLQVVLDIRSFHKSEGKIDPRTDFERYMDDIAKHTGGKVQMELKEGTQLQTLVEDHTDITLSRNRREIILFGYFFLLIAVVLLFGFWIGYPIFMALFLRYYSRETWKLTAYLTGGSWIVMYAILVLVLQQILFEGFVTQYIVDNWLPE